MTDKLKLEFMSEKLKYLQKLNDNLLYQVDCYLEHLTYDNIHVKDIYGDKREDLADLIRRAKIPYIPKLR